MNFSHRPAQTCATTLQCETVRHRSRAILVAIGIVIGMAIAFASFELDRFAARSFFADPPHHRVPCVTSYATRCNHP